MHLYETSYNWREMVLIWQEEHSLSIDDVICVSVLCFYIQYISVLPIANDGNQCLPTNIQEYSSDCSSSETMVLRPLCMCSLIVSSRIWLTWFTHKTSRYWLQCHIVGHARLRKYIYIYTVYIYIYIIYIYIYMYVHYMFGGLEMYFRGSPGSPL